MKHQTIVVVTAEWDDEASVWVATSEDESIGLVTEAPSLDELKDRVIAVLPELLRDNLRQEDDNLEDLLQVCLQSQHSVGRSYAH